MSNTERICELLLELAGKNTGRVQTATIHARVLEEAFTYMTQGQQAVARARLEAIQTKWGPLLWKAENCPETPGFLPEMQVARWLSTRRNPERLLYILRRAAIKVSVGETSMSRIMDYAYAHETDFVIFQVGQTSFTEWMLELRIARRSSKGVYAAGTLCDWWINDMIPSRDKTSSYAVCLKQREQMKYPWLSARV